jgi:hypothetical protein
LRNLPDRNAPRNPTDKRMLYWGLLSADEQRAAIVRLSESGISEATIGTTTGLSVEAVRAILAEQSPSQGPSNPHAGLRECAGCDE